MNKLQFLEILGQKLSEELPRSQVISNLQYYESYIDGAVQAGKSEKEVLEELGDPHLIARTIMDTQTGEAFYEEQFAEDADYVQTETTYTEKDGKYTAEGNSEYKTSGSSREEKKQTYAETRTVRESDNRNSGYQDQAEEESHQNQWNVYHAKSSHGCLIMALILTLIVVIVVTVVGTVVSFLWPVLVPVLLVLLVVSVFSDKRR